MGRRFVLQFINPVYHQGLNLTIRKGIKWYNQAPVGSKLDIVKTGRDCVEVEATICGTRRIPFLGINEHELQFEHDPSCDNFDGLEIAMRKAYQDFIETDEVTMLFFWIDETK